MKTLFAIAALLLASTAAQAQYTFEYGGRTIRIDPDRGTVSIPGVYDNSGRKTKRAHGDQDSDRSRKQTPQQANVDPQAPAAEPAPADQALAPANTAAAPSTATAVVAPADTASSTPPASTAPAPAAPPPPASRRFRRTPHPLPGRRTRDGCDDGAGAEGPRPGGSAGQFAARRLADRGEGRQGPHRAVRRQSLRLFRRCKIEPERRTGADQHEARQGCQMERPDSRPQHRQHL